MMNVEQRQAASDHQIKPTDSTMRPLILGIVMANIPPKSYIRLPQNPSYQAKVSYVCSEKLSASGGAFAPRSPEQGPH